MIMDRSVMHIGQQVKLPAKDIINWSVDPAWEGDPNDDFAPLVKNVKHQKEKILFVRELHNTNVAGLSYTMNTPPERSMAILYEVIEPL